MGSVLENENPQCQWMVPSTFHGGVVIKVHV